MNIKDKTKFLLNMGEQDIHSLIIEEVEKEIINTALIHCHGNQSEVARRLGINRTTLKAKMVKYK
jgi:DNA-binding protein Fis